MTANATKTELRALDQLTHEINRATTERNHARDTAATEHQQVIRLRQVITEITATFLPAGPDRVARISATQLRRWLDRAGIETS